VNLMLDAKGVVTNACVGLGAVAARPLLASDAARALIGGTLDAASIATFEEAVRAACKPIDDKRGTREFRIKVAGVMARRAALKAYERARSR
jgi:carbon-monoxide dehydrogenase medium subunit